MPELNIAFAEFNFTTEVAFKPVCYEDVVAPGVYMRVSFKADRRILEDETADVAKSGTKTAT